MTTSPIDRQALREAADMLVTAIRGAADDILDGKSTVADAAKELVGLLDDFLFFGAGGSHDHFVQAARMMDIFNEKLAHEGAGEP